MFCFQLIVLIFFQNHALIYTKVIDYFDERFDESKNCKKEDEMEKAKKEGGRCATVSLSGDDVSDELQWEECKKRLSQNLQKKCSGLGFKKPGDLLYCKDRGRTSCCFVKEKCIESFKAINNEVPLKRIIKYFH